MQKAALAALSVIALAAPMASAVPTPADDITNFHTNFRGTGWSYRWNKAAPLGSVDIGPVGNAAYPSLAFDPVDNRLETDGTDPAATNLYINSTSLQPGKAIGQDASVYERYALITYTVKASDIPNPAVHPVPFIWLRTYSFALAAGSPQTDGVNARFYVDNAEASAAAYGGPIALAPGQGFNEGIYSAFPLGPVTVGTTVTFAIGSSGPATYPPFGGPLPSGTVSNDAFDQVNLDFTLSIADPPPGVPEPASLGLLALGGVALMRRRRRTV